MIWGEVCGPEGERVWGSGGRSSVARTRRTRRDWRARGAEHARRSAR